VIVDGPSITRITVSAIVDVQVLQGPRSRGDHDGNCHEHGGPIPERKIDNPVQHDW
jgi:hypothetical protein